MVDLKMERSADCCRIFVAVVCWITLIGCYGEAKTVNFISTMQDVIVSKRHSSNLLNHHVKGKLGHIMFTSVNAAENGASENFGTVFKRIKRSMPAGDLSTTIPSKYIVVVTLGAGVNNGNRSIDTAVQSLQLALSKVLNWSVDKIKIDKISLAGKVVGVFFLRNVPVADDILVASDLIPAKDIIFPGLVTDLQGAAPDLNITGISQDVIAEETPIWTKPFFPYVTAAVCMAIVTIVTIMVYVICCVCCKNKKVKLEESASHLQIFYPTIKPDVKNPLGVQPASSPLYIPKGSITPTLAQPTKKRLLERRGSNASLTIDLNPSPEMARWDGTPPKESSGVEFLMSAGNRLCRRDLRNYNKNTKDIYEEFWEIPMNHTEKVSVAGSGMKNRYKSIIPNEPTRVILSDCDGDPLSSYINANYIRGYEGEGGAYIATQGPMPHTIVDFWKMVWSERSPIIVMITKLQEKSKPKCENYLPDTFALFGDIEVTVDRCIQRSGFQLRHLTLRCDGEHHIVLHYWYTAWPDQRPSESPRMLLQLIKEVDLRRYKGTSQLAFGPVIVHCSAGIGRTGCFIAISIGMRQLREEESVDILGIVCSMRLDRGGMIQTHEQYEFIHQALCTYEQELTDDSTVGE